MFANSIFQMDARAYVHAGPSAGLGTVYTNGTMIMEEQTMIDETFYSIQNCYVETTNPTTGAPFLCNLGVFGCSFAGTLGRTKQTPVLSGLRKQKQEAKVNQPYPDVIVYEGQVRTILPGFYQNLRVYDRATLNLAGFSTGAIFTFAGNVRVGAATINFLSWNSTVSSPAGYQILAGSGDSASGQIRLSNSMLMQWCSDNTLGSCFPFDTTFASVSNLVLWGSFYVNPAGRTQHKDIVAMSRDQIVSQVDNTWTNSGSVGIPTNVAIFVGSDGPVGQGYFTVGQLLTGNVGNIIYVDQHSQHVGCVNADYVRISDDTQFYAGVAFVL